MRHTTTVAIIVLASSLFACSVSIDTTEPTTKEEPTTSSASTESSDDGVADRGSPTSEAARLVEDDHAKYRLERESQTAAASEFESR